MRAVTKREAMKVAHRIAYRFIEQALSIGGAEASMYHCGKDCESDQKKIDDALDTIAQRHFELGHEDGK